MCNALHMYARFLFFTLYGTTHVYSLYACDIIQVYNLSFNSLVWYTLYVGIIKVLRLLHGCSSSTLFCNVTTRMYFHLSVLIIKRNTYQHHNSRRAYKTYPNFSTRYTMINTTARTCGGPVLRVFAHNLTLVCSV